MKKIFLIDNYDSFTYNLLYYLEELGCEVTVKRNDKFDLNEINNFDAILISPGPGIPQEAGKIIEVIKKYYNTKNIFGVCLGQQAIAEAFGGRLRNLEKVYHGVSSKITTTDSDVIFDNLKSNLNVGRYHSWIVDNPIPHELKITSVDENGEIMSIKHKDFNVRGVQFHPESILTPDGKTILNNWINTI
jgi:anthranilate synthase component 2